MSGKRPLNIKQISFATVVTAVVGLLMGLALAEIGDQRYVSSPYRDLPVKLALAGAALGAAVGAGQETVRELNQHQAEDQAKASFFHQDHSE